MLLSLSFLFLSFTTIKLNINAFHLQRINWKKNFEPNKISKI